MFFVTLRSFLRDLQTKKQGKTNWQKCTEGFGVVLSLVHGIDVVFDFVTSLAVSSDFQFSAQNSWLQISLSTILWFSTIFGLLAEVVMLYQAQHLKHGSSEDSQLSFSKAVFGLVYLEDIAQVMVGVYFIENYTANMRVEALLVKDSWDS